MYDRGVVINKDKKSLGQGLVEFALILPLLLLIVGGIIDFSYVFVTYVGLSNAAREGSRYGIVSPQDYEGINNRVRESVIGVPPEDVDIQVWYDNGPGGAAFFDPNSASVGSRVVVQVSYDGTTLTPITRPFLEGRLNFRIANARTI